jgi:hypothetical protein
MEKLIYKDEDSVIEVLYTKDGIVLSQAGFIDGKVYRHDIITGRNGLKALKDFFIGLDEQFLISTKEKTSILEK